MSTLKAQGVIYIHWLQIFSLCNFNTRPCENCTIWTCFLSLNITFVSCFPPPVDGPPERHRSWFRAAQRAWGPDEYKNCITITVSVCACNHTHKRIWRACLLYLGLVLFPCCSFESLLGNITLLTVTTLSYLSDLLCFHSYLKRRFLSYWKSFHRFPVTVERVFGSPFLHCKLWEFSSEWFAYCGPVWSNPPWHSTGRGQKTFEF